MAGEVKSDWLTDDVYAAADANTVAAAINRSLGAAAAYVSTSQTTASTSYTDLTTTTDQVTVTIGPSGMVLVGIYANSSNDTTAYTFTTFEMSGTNTLTASGTHQTVFYSSSANVGQRSAATHLLTGLNTGSTTFKMKYKVNSGTGSWSDRRIWVMPL